MIVRSSQNPNRYYPVFALDVPRNPIKFIHARRLHVPLPHHSSLFVSLHAAQDIINICQYLLIQNSWFSQPLIYLGFSMKLMESKANKSSLPPCRTFSAVSRDVPRQRLISCVSEKSQGRVSALTLSYNILYKNEFILLSLAIRNIFKWCNI